MRLTTIVLTLLCSIATAATFAQAGSGHTTDPQSTSGSGGSTATGQAGATATPAAAPATPATRAGASPATLSRADQAMLKQMAQAQIDEIATAKVALDISKNDGVRKFAQTMVDDHSKALDSITALARSKNVALPTDPDVSHKAAVTTLRKMSGDAFDKAYIRQAGVADHSKVHAALQKGMANAKDPDLKALATSVEPTVAQHLDSAKSLQNGMATAAK
jgi:putative membrane protein